MDYFGINSPADLPKIREVLAEQLVQGTMMLPEDFATDLEKATEEEKNTQSNIVVNKSGELEQKEEE